MVDKFLQPCRFKYVRDFHGFGKTRGIVMQNNQDAIQSSGLLNGFIVDVTALNCTVAEWWKLMKFFAIRINPARTNILSARQTEFNGDLWLGADYYIRALADRFA